MSLSLQHAVFTILSFLNFDFLQVHRESLWIDFFEKQAGNNGRLSWNMYQFDFINFLLIKFCCWISIAVRLTAALLNSFSRQRLFDRIFLDRAFVPGTFGNLPG
jgi:hypothetical protein